MLPDRIEAATYLIAAAMTGGDIKLRGINANILSAVLAKLAETGAELECEDHSVRLIMHEQRPRAITISTAPYPGFPTDLQAQVMALDCMAEGGSTITETVFENRFMHVQELQRRGANIRLHGKTAVCRGVKTLMGAQVMATDLRASACLVLAGLVAEGETRVHRIYHVDRGYECIEEKLSQLGADIRRVSNADT